MIYFIGGPPKCGKTTLAKKLSKLRGISRISTDTLQNVIKPYMDIPDYAINFPASNQREESNDEKYSKYSTNEIIDAYQRQAKTLYRAIDMFTVSEITDRNDYIIEGYHVEPALVADLFSKYPDKVRAIFLIKTDVEKFVSDIKKSTTPNDWIIARTNNEETYDKIAKVICEYGKYFEMESNKYDYKVLNMDSDFDQHVSEAIEYLTKTPR